MTRDIIEISKYFMPSSNDQVELKRLMETAADKQKWVKAKAYFEQTRRKNISAQKSNNLSLSCLYSFIEACYKSLYNFTNPPAPFDPDSPYEVIKYALGYCQSANLEPNEIIKIIG